MSAVVLLFFLVSAVAVTTPPRVRSGGIPAGGPGVPQAGASERLRATARVTGRWRLTGLAAGLVVGMAAARQDALGRGLLLAAPLCDLCLLGGVVIGELRVSAPQGPVRSAGLEVRPVRDYLPRIVTRVVPASRGRPRSGQRAVRQHVEALAPQARFLRGGDEELGRLLTEVLQAAPPATGSSGPARRRSRREAASAVRPRDRLVRDR